MHLDRLVASGVEFNNNMNHEEVMRTSIDAFSVVPKIGSCLGSACSPLFEFLEAVDEELTKLNPALQWNLRMIRHIAGSGPLYIRSTLDIKKSENDFSSNEDSDLSDNECEDVSKTTFPSFRRIMTIDMDNSSKNAGSSLSESTDKIEPNPSNFDKSGKEKSEMSHSFQRTDGNTDSQKIVTGPGNYFKKPILTDEPKVCCPICHKQFHISVIAHHADSCAENSVQAYEAE